MNKPINLSNLPINNISNLLFLGFTRASGNTSVSDYTTVLFIYNSYYNTCNIFVRCMTSVNVCTLKPCRRKLSCNAGLNSILRSRCEMTGSLNNERHSCFACAKLWLLICILLP